MTFFLARPSERKSRRLQRIGEIIQGYRQRILIHRKKGTTASEDPDAGTLLFQSGKLSRPCSEDEITSDGENRGAVQRSQDNEARQIPLEIEETLEQVFIASKLAQF